MDERMNKACAKEDCTGKVVMRIRELNGQRRGRLTYLCAEHYRATSKHFRHEHEAKSYGHPTH